MSTIGTGTTLSFTQIEDLWKANGGNPLAAPIMAAIALAESGGLTNNLNDTPRTGDYSVGLWQINYYGKLGPGRTSSYGTPTQLAADPNAQAKAAISVSSNGNNLTPWTTYTSGTASRVLAQHGGALGAIPALPSYSAAAAPAGNGSVDNEGYLINLTMPSAIPNITVTRAAARKAIAGGVLIGGGVVGLAGVFVLVGSKAKLPGPAGVVQGAVGAPGRLVAARREGRQQEARVTMAARRDQQGRRDEAQYQASRATPDELTTRRRARARAQRERGSFDRAAEARDAAARDAEAAGRF